MANTTRPSVPLSHASESEHRRQIANVVNIINQTTPDYSRTAAEISAGVTPVDYRYPPGDVRRYGFTASSGVYTVKIPSDFATLQEAVDILSRRPMLGETIELQIESGHSPASGIEVSDGDYSYFRVTSVDATVTLSASFTFANSFIKATRAIAPRLACLVDANNKCTNGYHLVSSSSGVVEENCGVKNCANSVTEGAGLFLDGACQVVAHHSVFTGSYRNVWIAHSSQCYADHSTLSGCTGDANVYAARSSIVGVSYSDMTNSAGSGLRARRSLVTALAADVSNAAADGILAQEGSLIIANDQSTDPFLAENCGQHGVSADKSYVDFAGGSTKGATSSGIRATNGAKVIANGCTLSTALSQSARGINAESSIVIAQGVVINSPTSDGILGLKGSYIDATGGTIDSAGGRGADVGDASRLVLKSATITNSTSDGVRSLGVSSVDASGATVTGSGTFDFVVSEGGQINADGATTTNGSGNPAIGDTNATAFNLLTRDGVIFDSNSSTPAAALETATATAIADASDAINTTNKFAGKLVWDTTNTRLMRSAGSTPTSAWVVCDGSASVTPS